MVKIAKWDYPNHTMETVMIDKKIKDDLTKFCRERKIKKGDLVESFYKTILLRFKDGSLNISNGYITMNVFQSIPRIETSP